MAFLAKDMSIRQVLSLTLCFVVVALYFHVSEWRGLAKYGRREEFSLALPAFMRTQKGGKAAGSSSGEVIAEPEGEEEVEEVIEYVDEDPDQPGVAAAGNSGTSAAAANSAQSASASSGEEDDSGEAGSAGNNVIEDVVEETIPTNRNSESPLCIALAADLDQFENVVVVINSTWQHSRKKHLLLFRIITLQADRQSMLDQLRARLPKSVNVEAIAFDPWLKRVSRLVGGSSSGRQELFNELNFAAFYVHELMPTMPRVLYVDTDVVILGDVQAELSEWNMNGLPVGGAKDCSQKVGKYIFFKRIEAMKEFMQLPLTLNSRRQDCVVNRGVVLIDTNLWAKQNMTGLIEQLVQIHLSEDGPLWHSGVSQPPFLLAIAGRYQNMGYQYNVRGLGRSDMTVDEVRHWKHSSLWTSYMNKFLFICKFGPRKNWAFAPTIVAGAHNAKVLHFNGRNKPISRGRCSEKPVPSPQKTMPDAERVIFESRPLCSCGENCMQECAGIWWRYNSAVLPPQQQTDSSAE